jgi:hypothetical protein
MRSPDESSLSAQERCCSLLITAMTHPHGRNDGDFFGPSLSRNRRG